MQQPVREEDYPVLLAGSATAAGSAASDIAGRLESRGLRVITARTRAELTSALAEHGGSGTARISAVLLSWDRMDSEDELAAVLNEIQLLSDPPPVVLLSERADERAVPAALAGRTAGSFWLHADSPHFVADQVAWLVRTYALRSQVLGALAGDAATADGPF